MYYREEKLRKTTQEKREVFYLTALCEDCVASIVDE